MRNAATRATVRFLSPVLPSLVRYMAKTGEGTDKCLEKGCLPLSVHYYSPVPDIQDLEERDVWDQISKLITQRVELLDINCFYQLGNGDILFIDSGHVVRTGGDVNYLILDVLPRLAPGVIIHFHDINLPRDY